MADPTTANMQFAVPTRGSDTGTWDVPVNGNASILDLVLGGIATIGLNNSNVVLASSQFQSRTITFNSTLTGSVTITFPSTFTKSYEILNSCTGSSAFTITLLTTTSSGQAICAPPGEVIEMFSDGTNLKYKNFGRIGTYWDYAGSSVPAWVSGCTVPPYLNCDGGTFSAATYPALSVIMGSTTLPNSKGKTRYTLDQGAGLISTAATGFSTPNVGGTGGAQATTLGTSNLPPYTPAGSVNSVAGGNQLGLVGTQGGGNVGFGGGATGGATFLISPSNTTFTGTAQGGTSVAMTNLSPAYIGGLTLVRAG